MGYFFKCKFIPWVFVKGKRIPFKLEGTTVEFDELEDVKNFLDNIDDQVNNCPTGYDCVMEN